MLFSHLAPFLVHQDYFCLLLGISQNESALVKHFIFYHCWPPIPLRLTAVQQQPLCFHTGMQGESWKVSYNQEVKKRERNRNCSLLGALIQGLDYI